MFRLIANVTNLVIANAVFKTMANILLLNGPNLNLLGVREPGHYGQQSLNEIVGRLMQLAQAAGHELMHLQSNAEHELVNRIHQAREENVAYIIINPAAFTHTSVALRDALSAVAIPFVEVHLSNVYAREPFRKHSYFSDLASGCLVGFGPLGYELALTAVINKLPLTA